MMILSVMSMCAQKLDTDGVPVPRNPQQAAVKGRYHFITEEGDTALMVVLNNITYYPPLKFKNKKQEQFYWRTVREIGSAHSPTPSLLPKPFLKPTNTSKHSPPRRSVRITLRAWKRRYSTSTSPC
ncbi:hypothetical protein [uncultured Muribaculum sp.]|uniref:hypothetical protein n=1 Tax=uncultured Muribaculum sp. TaxID=1918613 RepID=UPI0026EA09F3|nr:hypothetical protein [uncultured Muribaculum sp.]